MPKHALTDTAGCKSGTQPRDIWTARTVKCLAGVEVIEVAGQLTGERISYQLADLNDLHPCQARDCSCCSNVSSLRTTFAPRLCTTFLEEGSAGYRNRAA